MDIKVLGTGCPKCKRLEKVTRDVLAELSIAAEVIKVTEMTEIMSYNILSTPGLVIEGELVSSGRLPSKAEITTMITTALART